VIPVVSGNVSLNNETGGRPIPPTPVVGCVGLVPDVTRIPSRWRSGDEVWLLRGDAAELVRFAWRNAHRFSLVHDVSDGGTPGLGTPAPGTPALGAPALDGSDLDAPDLRAPGSDATFATVPADLR